MSASDVVPQPTTESGGLTLRQDRNRRPTIMNLVKAEVRRFSHRRLIAVFIALSVLGYLTVMLLMGIFAFSKSTPEMLAQATVERDRLVQEQLGYWNECMKQPTPQGLPADSPPESYCGEKPTADELPVEQFLPRQPFNLKEAIFLVQPLMAGACAALWFLIGATWIGAEWSSRNLMAQLFWEPRRMRVLGVKAAVLAGAAALFTALAQAVSLGGAWLLAHFRGSTADLPDKLWSELVPQAGRGMLAVVLISLIAYSVVQLTRHTGAALGLAFGYFLVERVIAGLKPELTPWLIGPNMTALLSRNGVTYFVQGPSLDEQGSVIDYTEKLISLWQGGIFLTALAGALLLISMLTFARRDLT